jgi:hypothetical protein
MMDGLVSPVAEINLFSDALNYMPKAVIILSTIVLIYFAIYSIILLYHWLRYGKRSLAIWVALIIYFGVSSVIVGTLVLATRDLI